MFYRLGHQEDTFTAKRISRLLPEPHMHSHLELIYLTKGSSDVFLDTKAYTFEAGDLFIAFPNQIHFYQQLCPTQGYLIIFTPDFFKDLKEIFQTTVPDSPILHGDSLPPNFREMIEQICQKKKSNAPLSMIATKGLLLALLADILPTLPLKEHSADQNSIKRILVYCMEHYLEPISLDTVAKELYLNKCYVSHVFNQKLNVSFKDFINHQRIEHARKMLEKGTSITEVAFSSGFSSIRTFNRTFLKFLEISPREYLKSRNK